MVLIVSYLTLMFFRKPELSDALIVLSLSALFLVGRYLDFLFSSRPKVDDEILALDKKLTIEQYNLKIRDVQTEAHRKSLTKLGGNREETIW